MSTTTTDAGAETAGEQAASAFKRIQGKFSQPEPPKAATWHLTDLAARMPYDVARVMPHDSALVIPNQQLKILLMVPELVALGRMGLILGPAGTGKSVLLGCARAACPHRVAHVDLKSAKTEIGVAQAVYLALTGVHSKIPANRGSDPIWRAVEVELARTPTLLVVDEVQHVPNSALMALHDLAKRTPGRFGVLVAGIDKAKTRLQKDDACWRRFAFRTELRKIPSRELPGRLADWHPLFKTDDSKLIKAIDKVMCNGSWGQWANFVEGHQNEVGRGIPLTDASARRTLSRYSLTLPG